MQKLHLAALTILASCLPTVAHAALYTASFDSDDSANWTVNNNNAGVNAANIYYDYSTVGIPSAPHSTGGTTRGIKLGANTGGVAAPSLSGISVSPTGQSFTGNYTVRFDWWHNWLGSTTGGIGNAAGGSGSTQLSTFGVQSSGTTPNYAGSVDSVVFAGDGDGASASDYRIYAPESPSGYAVGVTGNNAHVVYAAGSQNNTAAVYVSAFPGGKTAPASQTTSNPVTQAGTTIAGTSGFMWNDVVIAKNGNIVTWTVNGVLLATVDETNFATPLTGSNILFGMADTSTGAGTPAADFEKLDFTLIDNVVVNQVVPEPTALAALAGAGAMAFGRRRK